MNKSAQHTGHHLDVIIALLPRDQAEDEHLTLVYAGEIGSNISAPFTTMSEVANRLAPWEG